MAWSRVGTISKLIVQVAGTNYPVENIECPDITPYQLNQLNSQGPTYYWFNTGVVCSGYTNWSSEDAIYYAQVEALTTPTNGLDIMHYLDMVSNGTAIYIFREESGINYRISITRTNGNAGNISGFSMRFYVNGYLVNSGVGWSGNNYVSCWLGFMTDGTNYFPYLRMLIKPYSGNHGVHNECTMTCLGQFGSQDAAFVYSLSNILISGNTPKPGPTPGPDEPYGDDTYTEAVGGDGDHDDTSDSIPEAALPIMYASNSGMCTAWVPSIGEIRAVAKALVDPNVAQAIWQSVAKLSDVVIGLSLFPCTIDTETTPQKVKVNFMGVHINTGVDCHLAADQFEEIDCGNITINEYWGNCLDYNPYTRISIYLPFCGMYELDTDEVMGRTINVSYRIDILSGACLATIKIDGSVFYQYSGQCSAQIPLSSVTFDQFIASMIDVGIATATGSKMLGAAGAALSEARQDFNAGKSSSVGGDALMDAKENYQAVRERTTNSIADAAVGAVMGQKGFYQHAGALAGSPGFLAIRKPYLIIKRPEQLIPGMYGKFHGFPSNTTAVLGDLVGYTEVGDIRLNIPEATVDEIIECEQLLKGGVVI